MDQSYLGIVTRQGLESLLPEPTDSSYFWQHRRSRTTSRAAVYCWAILSDEVARELHLLLKADHCREALVLLHAEAKSLGTLLFPPRDDQHFSQA